MNRLKITVGATALLLAIVAVNSASVSQTDADHRQIVDDIASAGQTYDGELEDRLAALGRPGVPAIGDALLEVTEFHSSYAAALARIGDPRAVSPIMEVLARQEPLEPDSPTYLIVNLISALKDLHAAGSADYLIELYNSESAHPKVRLAAASGVCQIVGAPGRDEASAFIFSMYEKRSHYFGRHGAGFDEVDIYSALMDTDTDRATAILTNYLSSGVPARTHMAIPIIEYLSATDDERVEPLLADLIEDPYSMELPVRLTALEALHAMDLKMSRSELDSRTNALIEEIESGGWPDQFHHRVEQLKANR